MFSARFGCDFVPPEEDVHEDLHPELELVPGQNSAPRKPEAIRAFLVGRRPCLPQVGKYTSP